MDKGSRSFGKLTGIQKRLLVSLVDTILLFFSVWVAFSLRFGEPMLLSQTQLGLAFLAPAIAIPIFFYSGLYRAVIRYMGEQALWTVVKAVALATALWVVLVAAMKYANYEGVPFSVMAIYWLLATSLTVSSRLMLREFMWRPVRNSFSGDNVLVYGAGDAGVQLVQALLQSRELYPVGFLDDDSRMSYREVAGLKVFQSKDLGRLIERYGIKEVLVAIPSATRARRGEIIRRLQEHRIHARVLPTVGEIASGKVSVGDLREVDAEDLLGRDTVPPNEALLTRNIRNKTILVTGAGGSIGSELCRQILRLSPAKLILLDSCEHALYQIDRQLAASHYAAIVDLVPLLGSVMNTDFVTHVFESHCIDTVYHAAAYKHVPLMEHNEFEGVRNNVFGTLNVAEAALHSTVETFVLISTDKAVRPTNMMGGSKRVAELVLQAMHERLQLRAGQGRGVQPVFCMVRFGNVLGSSGSVIPLFREQIKTGGPVTVTHPRVTRYFMSTVEAAQLVLQAGALAKGGDVFLLDMGQSVRILDLARQMIRLSGLQVLDEEHLDGDIKIEFTGLRAGEKLYEELLIGNNPIGTAHPKIMRAEEEMLSWSQLQILLDDIKAHCKARDREGLRRLVLDAANTSLENLPLVRQTGRPRLKAVESKGELAL
ncbi:MAG: polysaccharide biosynthesis protein [Thiotrichales bacterium]